MLVSYDVGLKGEHACFREMVEMYRGAVKLLVYIANLEWDVIKDQSSVYKMTLIEQMIHATKERTPKYKCFDEKFPKFPVFLRRSAINEAVGIVRSYRVNTKLWEEGGCIGKKPTLIRNRNVMPIFYRDNMFRLKKEEDGYSCRLKVCSDGKWIWKDFEFDKSDIGYITSRFDIESTKAPRLKKNIKKYSLVFCFDVKVDKRKNENLIMGVDIGINTAAVCSWMDRAGFVKGRKFISFPVEMDRMRHVRKDLKRARSYSLCKPNKLKRWARDYNREICIKTAHEIVECAEQNGVDVIAMEMLDRHSKKINKFIRNRQDLAWWRKIELFERVRGLAGRKGIKVDGVCAYNSSRLAFDGSGVVSRDDHNVSICKFPTGKVYNADLNASYNIAARYVLRCIREKFKRTYGKDKSLIKSRFPELVAESQSTLDTLRKVNSALSRFPEMLEKEA